MKKSGDVHNTVNIMHTRATNGLGQEITKLSAVTRDLLHAADPATRKSILLLISHTCGVKQKHVKRVLEAASQLQRKYVP